MQIFRGLNAIKLDGAPRSMTIGSFYGVHLGHRALMGQVVSEAKKIGGRSTILSFDPHPAEILRPETRLARLFSVNDMAEQLTQLGVNELVLEPFSIELSKLSAREFIQRILKHLNLKVLFIGYDFAIGKNREGGVSELKNLGKEFGFAVVQISAEQFAGAAISSSRIRKLIESGDVDQAQRLLGRPYALEGEVESGDGRGRSLGFATANLKCRTVLKPAAGVYITRFHLLSVPNSRGFVSVTNIGYKPTFYQNHELTIETHVLDTDQNFVGEPVRVELMKRLRDELKFQSAHELISQIEKDVRQTRKFFDE